MRTLAALVLIAIVVVVGYMALGSVQGKAKGIRARNSELNTIQQDMR